MYRMAHLKRWFVVLVSTALAGCMPQMTMEDIKTGFPQGPPELDKLDVFVGQGKRTGDWPKATVPERRQVSLPAANRRCPAPILQDVQIW